MILIKRRLGRLDRTLLIFEPIGRTALMIIGVAIGALLILSIRYSTNRDYPTVASDSLKLILIGTAALAILLIFKMSVGSGMKKMTMNKMRRIDPLDYILATASYVGIQVSIMALRNISLFQVSAVDIWAFYISAAVIEELTYRLTLISIAEFILYRFIHMKPKTQKPLLIFLSGIIFALVHTRYLGDPILFLLTFLGGMSQAYWFLRTRSILPCIMAHSVINFMAAGSLIQQLR